MKKRDVICDTSRKKKREKQGRSERHFNYSLKVGGGKASLFFRKFQPSPSRPSDISSMKIEAKMNMLEL
jgi:hypothetical protein